MRHLFRLSFLIILSSACSTTPKAEPWLDSYLNKTGYFNRPIDFMPDSPADPQSFQRCKKSKIVGFKNQEFSDDTEKPFIILIEQDGQIFHLFRVGNRKLVLNSKLKRIRLIDRYFKKYLNKTKRTEDLAELGKVKVQELKCKGLIWSNMTERDLLFVKGRPDKIKINSNVNGQNREVWMYFNSIDPRENKEYHFSQKRLLEWKNINPQ